MWAKAAAEQTPLDTATTASAAAANEQAAVLQTTAPTLNAWMFTTGRALAEIGRLLTLAPDWLDFTRPYHSSPQQLSTRLGVVSQHVEVLEFLQGVLSQLQLQEEGKSVSSQPGDSSSAATSAGGDRAASLQALQQQVEGLLQRYSPLLEQRRAAQASAGDDPQALSAALDAFVSACDGGSNTNGTWLTRGLQEVGTAVASAFPQGFTCNEPTCTVMKGLTESLVEECDACKVRCRVVVQCVSASVCATGPVRSLSCCQRGARGKMVVVVWRNT